MRLKFRSKAMLANSFAFLGVFLLVAVAVLIVRSRFVYRWGRVFV